MGRFQIVLGLFRKINKKIRYGKIVVSFSCQISWNQHVDDLNTYEGSRPI